MDFEPSEEQIQRAKSFSAKFRSAVDGEAATSDLRGTITSTIISISRRFLQSVGPVQLLLIDYDLHDLWYAFIQAAKNTSSENTAQEMLVYHVLSAREMGALTRTRQVGLSVSPTTEIARTSNGMIWKDLPFLTQDLQDAWSKDSLKLSTTHRENLAAFIARLTSVGVCGNALAGCALWLFRDALETPRPLAVSDSESGSEVPLTELLPAVRVWLLFAAPKLIVLSDKSVDEFSSEVSKLGELARSANVASDGFSPSRWAFWRQRLEELSQCEQVEVAKEAIICLDMMKDSVNDIDSVMRLH